MAPFGFLRQWQILDMVLWAGRDLRDLKAIGACCPVGLGWLRKLCRNGQAGQAAAKVCCRNFLALDLPAERFDGIFAKRHLFNPQQRSCLARLRQLHQSLSLGGVLFQPPTREVRIRKAGPVIVYAPITCRPGRAFKCRQRGLSRLKQLTIVLSGLPREQQPCWQTVWRARLGLRRNQAKRRLTTSLSCACAVWGLQIFILEYSVCR